MVKIISYKIINPIPMDEKSYWQFNWTALFIVTACSSFLFSLIIKLLDGNFSDLLLIVAAITGLLSIISWMMSVLSNQYEKKRDKGRYSTDINPD